MRSYLCVLESTGEKSVPSAGSLRQKEGKQSRFHSPDRLLSGAAYHPCRLSERASSGSGNRYGDLQRGNDRTAVADLLQRAVRQRFLRPGRRLVSKLLLVFWKVRHRSAAPAADCRMRFRHGAQKISRSAAEAAGRDDAAAADLHAESEPNPRGYRQAAFPQRLHPAALFGTEQPHPCFVYGLRRDPQIP